MTTFEAQVGRAEGGAVAAGTAAEHEDVGPDRPIPQSSTLLD